MGDRHLTLHCAFHPPNSRRHSAGSLERCCILPKTTVGEAAGNQCEFYTGGRSEKDPYVWSLENLLIYLFYTLNFNYPHRQFKSNYLVKLEKSSIKEKGEKNRGRRREDNEKTLKMCTDRYTYTEQAWFTPGSVKKSITACLFNSKEMLLFSFCYYFHMLNLIWWIWTRFLEPNLSY